MKKRVLLFTMVLLTTYGYLELMDEETLVGSEVSSANTSEVTSSEGNDSNDYWEITETYPTGGTKVKSHYVDGILVQRNFYDEQETLIQANYYYSNGNLQQKITTTQMEICSKKIIIIQMEA